MNVSSIVSHGRCMSCGFCESLCSRNAIHMEYIEKEGFYRPHIDEKLCIDCGLCKKNCPAENQVDTSIMGEYREIYLAHSTDKKVRHEATSGGCIHSLIDYLLDKRIVDTVLMAGYDKNSPIETGVYIITYDNRYAFQKNPRDFASRYVSIPVLAELKKFKKSNNKIAIVGTPCQMIALTTGNGYNNSDIFKIGITCSGGMSYRATLQYKQIKSMNTSKMFYRGNGWPGFNSLISNEKNVECAHLGSLFERMFSSQIFKNHACRFCKDHFAEKADISFCDFWNKDELANESEGNSCVILRSDRAIQYFDACVTDGYIETVRSLCENEVIDTQLQVLKSKKSNLRDSRKCKFFMKVCEIIFSTGIYKNFNIEDYERLCSYYGKICRTVRFSSKQ